MTCTFKTARDVARSNSRSQRSQWVVVELGNGSFTAMVVNPVDLASLKDGQRVVELYRNGAKR